MARPAKCGSSVFERRLSLLENAADPVQQLAWRNGFFAFFPLRACFGWRDLVLLGDGSYRAVAPFFGSETVRVFLKIALVRHETLFELSFVEERVGRLERPSLLSEFDEVLIWNHDGRRIVDT